LGPVEAFFLFKVRTQIVIPDFKIIRKKIIFKKLIFGIDKMVTFVIINLSVLTEPSLFKRGVVSEAVASYLRTPSH